MSTAIKVGDILTANKLNEIAGGEYIDIVSKTAKGLVPQLPDELTTTKFLRQDATWAQPNTSDLNNDAGFLTIDTLPIYDGTVE